MQLAWDEWEGVQVAIKFVARGSAYLSRATEREILNHRLLTGHPFIVGFREVLSNRTQQWLVPHQVKKN